LSLEVNDISAQRGGHLGNHASHQNGLDMDVGYFFEGINENYYGRSALKGKGFDPKFDRALLWNYLKTMMTYYHDQVYMIFVHSSIKKAMCAEAKRVGDLGTSDKGTDPIVLNALRRLYPESGHHNHFHVRLRCPKWDDKKGKVNCVNPKSDLLEVTGCWGGAKGKR
jgi:penicillin-insensitive murein endopeptidase